uniref:Uncharacterized protein n=1 Tax=Plectus sambesii TaxID=2011161 RepID=A0A914XGK0_9BILA
MFSNDATEQGGEGEKRWRRARARGRNDGPAGRLRCWAAGASTASTAAEAATNAPIGAAGRILPTGNSARAPRSRMFRIVTRDRPVSIYSVAHTVRRGFDRVSGLRPSAAPRFAADALHQRTLWGPLPACCRHRTPCKDVYLITSTA